MNIDLSSVIWSQNVSFSETAAAGSLYPAPLNNTASGTRIASDLIEVPSNKTLTVHVDDGFSAAAISYDASNGYLGLARGYNNTLPWTVGGGEFDTGDDIKKIVVFVRRNNSALLVNDWEESGLTISYEGGGGGMTKYLDSTGLSYFWGKLKAAFAAKSHTHDAATTSAAGFMSVTDKKKLDLAHYGTCSVAGSTKTVACTNFVLETGAWIAVKFTATNTATSFTLNVNSTGAKSVYLYGSASDLANKFLANHTYLFIYDGTYWRAVGDIDTNTTYTPASASPVMDGTAAVGTSAKYAREDHVHPTDTSRAPLASPTFTGTPAAPTAAAGTNTTQLATTAFVKTAVDNAVSPSTEVLDITPLTPSGVSSVSYIRVSRCGKMVHVQGMLTLASTAPSSAVTIATGLPVPPYNVIVEGIADAGSYTSFKRNLDVRVTTGGNLTVRYGAASTIYVFNLAYLEA